MKKFFLFIPFVILITACTPTIQRTVNVTKNLSSNEDSCGFNGNCWNRSLISNNPDDPDKYLNLESLSRKCLKYSISQNDLDSALEKGAKIITSQQWKQSVNYISYQPDYASRATTSYKEWDNFPPVVKSKVQNGRCLGISYIIEGKKSVLDKYAPKK